MGYINKTISKDEALIKQAKICKLSFLDRYLSAILYILGGIFAALNTFVLKIEPIAVAEQELSIASVVSIGVGAVLIVLMLILVLYRGMQAIGKVDKDAVIPGTVFARLFLFGIFGVAVGFGSFGVFSTTITGDIVNFAACIVFGIIVIIIATLKYKSIKLVVTDKRIFGRKNIWLTQSFDCPIDKADNVVVTFSFWGKMFNYATITIKSVGGEYKIKYVKSAEEFKNLVIDFAVKSN